MFLAIFLIAALTLSAQPFSSGPRVHAPDAGQAVDARLVIEDAEGLAWVSGPNGTFRYDGVRYLPGSVFGLPMTEAAQMDVTDDGTVWILLEDKIWWRNNAGRFEPLAGGYEAMAAAQDRLYVIQAGGLLATLTRQQGPARTDSLPGNSRLLQKRPQENWWITTSSVTVRQRQIQAGPDGRIWYGTFKSFSWEKWDGAVWTGATMPVTPPTDELWQVMPIGTQDFLSHDGHSIARHHRNAAGGAASTGAIASESRLPREHIFSSPYGTWFLAKGTCVQIMPDGVTLEYFRYSGSNPIYGLRAGKEVLWATIGTHGLLSFSRKRSVEWIQSYDSTVSLIMSVVRKGNRLLVTRSDQTLEVHPAAKDWDFGLGLSVRVPRVDWFGLPAAAAPYTDTTFAPDGTIWQILPKAGAVQLNEHGGFITAGAGHTAGRRKSGMRRITFSDDGRLWVASKDNLWEVLSIDPQPEYRQAGKWKDRRYIADFVKDREGALFAVAEGGLLRYTAGEWVEQALPACLLDPRLRTVAIESRNSIWFSYRTREAFSHAVRTSPKADWSCEHFGKPEGFPGATQFLRFDRQGRLWRGDEAGIWIARGPRRRLPEDWLRIGPDDGLLAGEMTPVFAEEPDGSVLVGVGHILHRIPPGLITATPNSPPGFSAWNDRGTVHPVSEAVVMNQGEDGALLISTPPAELPGALPPIEYRYGEGAWLRLVGYELPLSDSPVGQSTVQLRFAGMSLSRSLTLPVLPVWWRGWPARSLFGGLIGLVLWRLWPFFHRAAYRMRKWLYQRAHPPSITPFASLAAPPDWPEGTILRDRYKIGGLLARGGFSDVFTATDVRSGEALVIKRLRPLPATAERSPSWLKKRFLQEVGVASLLRHPGILPVLDTWFDDDGIPHIALPRVYGSNLREYLTAHAPLPLEEATHLLRCIAETVSSAHERGVIHCDLKPENIMIPASEGPERVRPVVVDFGTSALHLQSTVLSEQTITGGTLRYMAPEQLLGRYSTASDIYALAIMALELVAQTRYDSLDLPIDRDWEMRFTVLLAARGFGEKSISLLVSALRWDPTLRPHDLLRWTNDFLASLSRPN